MNLIESFKNMFSGATIKEIEALELRSRLDVLMAKHGGIRIIEPSEPVISVQDKLAALVAKHMGEGGVDNLPISNTPILGQESIGSFNTKSRSAQNMSAERLVIGTGLLYGTNPGSIFDTGPGNIFDMDSMSGPDGALLHDDLQEFSSFGDAEHI